MATFTNEDIARYAMGEMSEEEKSRLEEEMRADAKLAARVGLSREVMDLLGERLGGQEEEAALLSTLRGMRDQVKAQRGPDTRDMRKSSPKVVSFRKYMVGFAAAAAVLFAVVMLWPSDYLNSYGKTEMIGVTERGEGNDSLMQQASVYFNESRFDLALPLLEQAYQKDTGNQMALFYRGVSQLHLKAGEAARKDLQQVYAGGSLFQYEAAFYLAVSYAQDGDKNAAKTWLDRIPEGAPVAAKAAALRKRLGIE